MKVFSENQFGLEQFDPDEAGDASAGHVDLEMPASGIDISAGQPAERRRHTRYAVDGEAEVLLADGSQIFRGKILDISLSGCFIETRARLRTTIGTPVEMVFRANGVLLRTTATVRAVRARVGAGFLFDRLNARMYEELETLIWMLEGTKR